ncbi:MAG: DNA/pantothenate metabolism flavoprotein domain protein [Verrucomicrobia bacterium]|nr:DNA/pantothenate metabolism flavoprotein domain protein [Verrucomicrobiota bacterium]
MNCLVTAGPTYEPLDQARRLTNFSTGRLGTEWANFLVDQGHEVTLLVGEQATWSASRCAQHLQVFTTTTDLQQRLERLAGAGIDAVFHAAAVSDFRFGAILTRGADGQLREIRAGKIPTSVEGLIAELKPTLKLIRRLREWFPNAWLVGWKYEVDGGRDSVLAAARRQIQDNATDACVANGPAYGDGFSLLRSDGTLHHAAGREALFQILRSEFTVRARGSNPAGGGQL